MKLVRVVVLCLVSALFALCLSACGDSGSTAPNAGASASQQATASETTESGSAAEAPSNVFTEECLDEYGNVTLYSLVELTGGQLAALCMKQGFIYDTKETLWYRSEDGAMVAALDENGKAFSVDTYNAMEGKGAAVASIGLSVVSGYSDPQTAFEKNANCVVEDSFFTGDRLNGVAMIYGPTMVEYLVIISKNSDNLAQFAVFSEESLKSGLAEKLLGMELGNSFQEAWQNVTGMDHYGA